MKLCRWPDGANKKDVSLNRSIYSRLWTGGILPLACGAMLACGWPGGLAGGGLTDGWAGLGGGSGGAAGPVDCGSLAATDYDARWARGADDDPRIPHERAMEGPAVKPTIAPATAPTGPSTTAPDTAPSAASAARSCALASNEMSEPAISAPTRKILMTIPRKSFAQGTAKMRRQKGRQSDGNITKKPASGVRRGHFGFFDGAEVAVICPTCQCRLRGALAAAHLTKLR